MAIIRKYYNFKNPADMISLARAVQTGVYWGYSFHYEDENIGYKDFWDIVEAEYDKGAIAVMIEDDYISFTYQNNI